jgi:hypothetical protein
MLRAFIGADPPDMDAALEAYKTVYASLGGDEPCCTECRVYARYLWDVQRAVAARLLEHEEAITALQERVAALDVLCESYDAIRDAHEALLFEHEDLQASYYVTQQALRRAEKKDEG